MCGSSVSSNTHTDDEKEEVVGVILRITVVTDHVTCWKTNQTNLHTTVGVPVCVCACVYVADQSGMTVPGNLIDDIRV